MSAVQDRRALSLPLFGSEGLEEVRATEAEKDPSASNPAFTEKVAEADPPTEREEKEQTTFRVDPTREHPDPPE